VLYVVGVVAIVACLFFMTIVQVNDAWWLCKRGYYDGLESGFLKVGHAFRFGCFPGRRDRHRTCPWPSGWLARGSSWSTW